MKGILALDIDGTVACKHRGISPAVLRYLESRAVDGWQLIFITGRTFSWAMRSLECLGCSYHVAVQNGAAIVSMPEQRVVNSRYLDKDVIGDLEVLCREEPTDYVLYTGVENADRIYYRPHCFSGQLPDYVQRRCAAIQEPWTAVDSYDDVPDLRIASIKCFGKIDTLSNLSREFEALNLHAPLIRDPFCEDYHVLQATDANSNKGQALRDFVASVGCVGPTIAAGDDSNDIPMLEEADIAVVMGTGALRLQELADVVAPPAEEDGIITGLTIAIKKVGE